jgi:hypothetical protein
LNKLKTERARNKFKDGAGTSVGVGGLGELVDGSGDFEPLHEDPLLPLEEDVLGPPDESGKISSRENVAPDPEALGRRLEHSLQLLLRLLDSAGVAIAVSVASVSSWLYKNITQKKSRALPSCWKRYSLLIIV